MLWLINLGFAAGGAVTPLVEVPDVVGQSEASGTAELQGVGFVVAVVTANSSTVAAGDIISQDPIAGSFASNGSTVTITVSLGDVPVAEGRTPAGGYDRYRKPSHADEERDEDAQRLRKLIEQAASGQPSDVREAATAIVAAPVAVVAEVAPSALATYLERARDTDMKRLRINAVAQQIEAARIERIRRDDEDLINLLGASGLLQ